MDVANSLGGSYKLKDRPEAQPVHYQIVIEDGRYIAQIWDDIHEPITLVAPNCLQEHIPELERRLDEIAVEWLSGP